MPSLREIPPQYIVYLGSYAERSTKLGGWGVVVYDEWDRQKHPQRNHADVPNASQDMMELWALDQALKTVYRLAQGRGANLNIFTRSANVKRWIQGQSQSVEHAELVDQLRMRLQRHRIEDVILVSEESSNPEVVWARNLARKNLRDQERAYNPKKRTRSH